jgi:hypothetical protein
MSHRQVITITAEGTMQGLQVKPGQGLDLRQFGECKIVRASEIVFSEQHQKWYIDVLQEAGHGPVLIMALAKVIADEDNTPIDDELDFQAPEGWGVAENTEGALPEGTLLFNDYNDAVRVEILYLDSLRKQGVY